MTEPRWLDEQEMAAWSAFLEVSHLVERRVEQQLKEQQGLSHPQYEILVRLSDAPGSALRMAELADLVVTSKSSLTYQIGRLEKLGLVRRCSATDDERGVRAVLTDSGRATLDHGAPEHVALVRSSLIDLLSRDQLAALTDGLTTVRDALRQHGQD